MLGGFNPNRSGIEAQTPCLSFWEGYSR
jgi:hypothetical protein